MSKKRLIVKMFGQEDTVSKEFLDKADKALIEIIIKENIILKTKQQNYSPISEPVISEYEFLKQVGKYFMPVPDRDDADLIVFRTTVKVTTEAK